MERLLRVTMLFAFLENLIQMDFNFQFKSKWAKIQFKIKDPCGKPYLKMYLRGFRCFNPFSEDSPLGSVAIWGGRLGIEKDDVSGGVSKLEAPRKDKLSSWRADAESFLNFIRKGLGLAHGGSLRTPAVQFGNGKNVEIAFYAGQSFQAEAFNIFSSLCSPHF